MCRGIKEDGATVAFGAYMYLQINQGAFHIAKNGGEGSAPEKTAGDGVVLRDIRACTR